MKFFKIIDSSALAEYRRGILLLTLAIFFGCGREQVSTDTEPPPTPQFVSRSADTAWVETGIDAVPEGDWIKVVWLPVTAEDLAGYRLYRQADSVNAPPPELILDLTEFQAAGDDTLSYLDMDPVLAPIPQSGLTRGFFYLISAYDDRENESPFSNPCFYELMVKPSLYQPVMQNNQWLFRWSYNQLGLSWQYFVIRLFRETGSEFLPYWVTSYSLPNPLEITLPDTLPTGNYQYQVDVIGATPADRPSGGEEKLLFTNN